MTLEQRAGIIARANQSLLELYGPKHVEITYKDIAAVYSRDLLSVQADAKTRKGTKKGYLTGILYLAPAGISGIETCPGRSIGCTKACLFSAGRGRFYSVSRARVLRTLAYHLDRDRFSNQVKISIEKLITRAKNKNLIPVVRLNGTSDLLWERNTNIIQSFPNIQFYDYTKIHARVLSPGLPKNYHLTYSLHETNQKQAMEVLKAGGNIAAVFFDNFPKTYLNTKTINGDETDLRFLDKRSRVVALKAKGQAKKDTSGFVIG